MLLFANPATWPHSDLVAATVDLDPRTVLAAYREGVFPMPLEPDLIGWFSPLDRGVLPLDGLRVTRSLRKSMKHYRVSVDQAYEQVVDGCADPRREAGWIDADIRRVYGELHQAGVVHSVEVWDAADRLVGGLYGVSIGGLFAGESMFHDPQHGRDASKTALVELVRLLSADGLPRLLDVQWLTPHLASLGAVELSRRDYLSRLRKVLDQPPPAWPVAD
ncbi:leucyl/phenylalanyl-tRNA--protein transferase [Enemella evansiae]|uniref:Leucyl/phenylalanyl-tRNA--protein transferase n=1 Tax=Enemella evansiae TaxID=2016499 RepID=A0A255GF53_9ACTN|nr:leucyl/phenylalanyl-tRNA--protein transferase [Enemella evansiae]OYO10985.1 leucyl/phenylalanyl-tRNA--protein transferase [Enemella evansiae]OYO12953.1 leucyl/phenylalanyl-tRNA--protein transferase [Enemella evansiae]